MERVSWGLVSLVICSIRLFLVLVDGHGAADLGQHGLVLRPARLEQLLNAGQTLRDVLAGRNAAGVEVTHGQLRAGLADRLRRDDADSLADVHLAAVGHVHAIAAGADAVLAAAGEHGAHQGLLHAVGRHQLGLAGVDGLVQVHQHLPGHRIHNVLGGGAAAQPLLQGLDRLLAAHQLGNYDAADLFPAGGEAVFLADDDLLGHVHQTAGQVTRVGGTQSGIGQGLAAAVGGQEELQHVQAFAEVGADGQLHGLAGGRGHQAAHAGQLADLGRRAAGAGVGHHADGVELFQVGQDLVAQVGGAVWSRPR